MNESNYGLLVGFPDQSETFVLGFEAGQVWERLLRGTAEEQTIHSANEEVIRRIARHFGFDAAFVASGVPGWAEVSFSRSRPRLSVVGAPSASPSG